MKLCVEGTFNLRDLGGIVCAHGVTAKGRLLRSAELSRLTLDGQKQLLQLGLQRIVDLRTQKEMENAPDAVPDGVQHVNVPIISATTFGITYEKSSPQEIAQMLQAGYQRMKQRNETLDSHMTVLYLRFVQDEFCRNGYGNFLRLLAQGPVQGATLWHCSAGKDRVGTCTALLLHCLGASKQQIFEDYMLTNQQSAQRIDAIQQKLEGFVSDDDLVRIRKMLSVEESYLQEFFDGIDSQFGGVDAFLENCGVTKTHVEMLRNNYLQ